MNSYQATIKELFSLQQFSIKMGLDNIAALCKKIGEPQNKYPTIHIAGTNGKGSTAFIIQQILIEHGLKTGLYTSPHLVDFRERIRVNNEYIDAGFVTDFWQRIKADVESLKATFFDTTTLMAFEYFNRCLVDVAIIETGLGGRLDSTNVLNPDAVVITPIDFDHQKQLGNDLLSIAREKAGIIKDNSTLFLGVQQPEVENYFVHLNIQTNQTFNLNQSITVYSPAPGKDFTTFEMFDKLRDIYYKNLVLSLRGFHQIDNTCLAYLVSRWYIEKSGIKWNQEKFKALMANLIWPGRIQKAKEKPDVYIDVSHNPQGIKKTMEYVTQHYKPEQCILLFGLVEDKDYINIIKYIKDAFKKVVVTEPHYYRILKAETIADTLKTGTGELKIIKDVKKAYEHCISNMAENDTLFVMGSHYIAGEIIKLLDTE